MRSDAVKEAWHEFRDAFIMFGGAAAMAAARTPEGGV